MRVGGAITTAAVGAARERKVTEEVVPAKENNLRGSKSATLLLHLDGAYCVYLSVALN